MEIYFCVNCGERIKDKVCSLCGCEATVMEVKPKRKNLFALNVTGKYNHSIFFRT